MKVILIIDKEEEDKEEEDFENLIELLTEFAEEGGRETLVFLNKKSLKISEINHWRRLQGITNGPISCYHGKSNSGHGQ